MNELLTIRNQHTIIKTIINEHINVIVALMYIAKAVLILKRWSFSIPTNNNNNIQIVLKWNELSLSGVLKMLLSYSVVLQTIKISLWAPLHHDSMIMIIPI